MLQLLTDSYGVVLFYFIQIRTECVQALSPQERQRLCQFLERDPREEIQLLYK